MRTVTAAIDKVARDSDLAARLQTYGLTPGGGTPEAFSRQITRDVTVCRETAKRLNLKFGT